MMSRCFIEDRELASPYRNELIWEAKGNQRGHGLHAHSVPFDWAFFVPLLAKHLCPFVKVPIVQLLNCDCFTHR